MFGTLLSELPGADAWPVADCCLPVQTHAWIQARIALAPARQQRLFAVEQAGRVTALVPLYLAGGWLREPPAMFEPSDLVYSNVESLQTLADSLAGQSQPVFLERLPLDSPTLAAMRHAYKRRGVVLVRPAMPTPVIPLTGREMNVDAWFNAGRRSDFRRAERLAAGYGKLSYHIQTPADQDELNVLLAEAYAMEAKSWKVAAGTALTTDLVQGSFFTRFARAATRQGMLRCVFLRVDGRTIAMQIGCEWQQRFWLFKISHDQAFAKCSPGHLLIRHTLQHAVLAGMHTYEFMGVMDDWTRQWTQDVREYAQVRAIPCSGTALKMLIKKAARAALNRF